MLNDGLTPPKDNRMLAIALCAAAALMLVYSAISHRWLENRKSKYMKAEISLLSTNVCMEEDCKHMSNGELITMAREQDPKNASGAFAPMGITTMALLLVAAVGLLASAAAAGMKKRITFPMLPTTAALLALMIALITGCVFVATKPGGVGGVGVGLGFWAFGIGCVVGIAGAQMITTLIKPVDPDVPADAWTA